MYSIEYIDNHDYTYHVEFSVLDGEDEYGKFIVIDLRVVIYRGRTVPIAKLKRDVLVAIEEAAHEMIEGE